MTETTIPDDIHHKRRFWAAHIKAFEQSGFSRSEYCRRHDLSYHALTYWLRRDKQKSIAASRINLVQLPMTPACSAQSTQPGIILRVGSRYTLELNQDFNQSALARVLVVLESR